jgi:thiol-disulfide isomerase/thioredoxin
MHSRLLSVTLSLVGVLTAPVSGQMAADYVESPRPLPLEEAYEPADFSWTLQTVRGKTVSLSDYVGKVLFINMWATWCAPCIAEMHTISALRDSLSDTDVEFLLISPEEPRQVRRFLRRFGHIRELPVLVERQRVPEAYGLEALPTSYIIDRNGQIVFKLRGTTNWDTAAARDLLRALSEEET